MLAIFLQGAATKLQELGEFLVGEVSLPVQRWAIEEEVRKQYADVIFNTHIRDNVSLSEAPGANCSIFDYDTKSKGAQDYLELTKEILKRTM